MEFHNNLERFHVAIRDFDRIRNLPVQLLYNGVLLAVVCAPRVGAGAPCAYHFFLLAKLIKVALICTPFEPPLRRNAESFNFLVRHKVVELDDVWVAVQDFRLVLRILWRRSKFFEHAVHISGSIHWSVTYV